MTAGRKSAFNTILGVTGLVILIGAVHAVYDVARHAYLERDLANVAKAVVRGHLSDYTMRGLFAGATLAVFFALAGRFVKDDSRRRRVLLLSLIPLAGILVLTVFAATWIVRMPLADQAASELAPWLIVSRIIIPALTDPITLPRVFIALASLVLLVVSFLIGLFIERMVFGKRTSSGEARETRMRIGVAGLAVFILSTLAYAAARPEVEDTLAPDVILISIDTLRSDHLGCYGYPRGTSPSIDRLAKEGLVVEEHISHSPWTLPSHISIFTGLMPFEHGVTSINRAITPRTPVLAEDLKERGYKTGAFVTNYLLSPTFGYASGFDTYVLRADFPAEEVVRLASQWLARNPKPAFLFLHLYDAHYPYKPRPAVRGKFGKKDDGLDEVFKKPFFDFVEEAVKYDEEKFLDVVARYDEEILDIDTQLGKFFKSLHEMNRYDRTWIVVTSDHGEEFRDHGLWGHSITLFEEVLRVPLVIKPPGQACADIRIKGRVVPQKALFNLVHGISRRIDLSSLGCRDGEEPKFLSDLLADGVVSETEVFAPHRFAIRKDGKKLIESYRFSLPPFTVDRGMELYDLAADPKEQSNIFSSGAAPEYEEMMKKLNEAREKLAGREVGSSDLSPDVRETLKSLGYLQ